MDHIDEGLLQRLGKTARRSQRKSAAAGLKKMRQKTALVPGQGAFQKGSSAHRRAEKKAKQSATPPGYKMVFGKMRKVEGEEPSRLSVLLGYLREISRV